MKISCSKHIYIVRATYIARLLVSRRPTVSTGLTQSHQLSGSLSSPNHCSSLDKGITNSVSQTPSWWPWKWLVHLCPDLRSRMINQVSAHSPRATCSWRKLRDRFDEASRLAWRRANPLSVKPGLPFPRDAKSNISASSVESGDVDGLSSGWTSEASWAILLDPRLDRDARLIVHVGKKDRITSVVSELPCMCLSGRHKISPQVRKPKKVRKNARGNERL